ncbi:MAG: hypothetical protein KatS3mg033_1081 [Thermonema sp.]|nr:MAG: hypothetical protein KatS3mg033_1081 [Thermonema sp.]
MAVCLTFLLLISIFSNIYVLHLSKKKTNSNVFFLQMRQ